MINIFAREITDDLTSLVKQIDEKVKGNKEEKAQGFVVFLTDDPDELEPKLEKLAEKHKIEVPLTVYEGLAGPESYKIDEDAAVTVMMWKGLKVKVNHAFTKDKFNKAAVKKVVEDTDKLFEED